MESAREFIVRLFRIPFVRYVLIGGTTFALDFALLILLHDIFGQHVIVAATVSYWASIAFNFVANRTWTFEASENHIFRHLTAYLLLLAANYLFTVTILSFAAHIGIHYTIAKLIAVAIQVTWTYFIYRKYIFK